MFARLSSIPAWSRYWFSLLVGGLLLSGFVAGPVVADGDDDEDVIAIEFDDVKFDIEPDGDFERDMLTEEIEDLHKKVIRVSGWILPSSVFRQRGIRQFVLVRDNMECCFGPGAALYDCMIVEMEEGAEVNFTTNAITVEGQFRIREFKFPDGKHYAIYHLTGLALR